MASSNVRKELFFDGIESSEGFGEMDQTDIDNVYYRFVAGLAKEAQEELRHG